MSHKPVFVGRCCGNCRHYSVPDRWCGYPVVFPDSRFGVSAGVARLMNPLEGTNCKCWDGPTSVKYGGE